MQHMPPPLIEAKPKGTFFVNLFYFAVFCSEYTVKGPQHKMSVKNFGF